MKALIMRLTQRISIESGGHTSIESLMFREFLLHKENFNEVYFCDKIIRNNADNYVDIFTVDLNNYDVIYIMNSPANFFGGIISEDTIEKFKKISKFNGKIYYVINDPKLFYVDTAIRALKKKQLTEIEYNNFNDKISNMKVIFTGTDYELFESMIKHRKNFYKLKFEKNISLFEFTFLNYNFNKNVIQFNKEKEFDLVYYGDNRGGYRDRKLKQYFDNNILKTKTIGLKKDYRDNYKLKKIKNNQLSNEMQDCYSSLILGDKEHNNNWITYRFFEGILAKVIIFIDIEYDTEQKYLESDLLKSLCYVSSPEQIRKNIQYILDNNLYDKIIELQLKELEKYNYLKINN